MRKELVNFLAFPFRSKSGCGCKRNLINTSLYKQSEIVEEDDGKSSEKIDEASQKDNIRKIISYQKSLYLSSSSSSDSLSASSRSFSSSSRSSSSSLLELMKVGGMSLGRLFDMEHTTLAVHFKNYSGSPLTRPLFLWGSDSCDESQDLTYWSPVKSFRSNRADQTEEESFDKGLCASAKSLKKGTKRLTRKRSYRVLPRLRFWRLKGFRLLFWVRRRLNVKICGRVFH